MCGPRPGQGAEDRGGWWGEDTAAGGSAGRRGDRGAAGFGPARTVRVGLPPRRRRPRSVRRRRSRRSRRSLRRWDLGAAHRPEGPERVWAGPRGSGRAALRRALPCPRVGRGRASGAATGVGGAGPSRRLTGRICLIRRQDPGVFAERGSDVRLGSSAVGPVGVAEFPFWRRAFDATLRRTLE